ALAVQLDDLFHFPTLQHLVGHLRLLQSKVSFAGGWVNSFSALPGHFKPGADSSSVKALRKAPLHKNGASFVMQGTYNAPAISVKWACKAIKTPATGVGS
ncbi:hypothetical protein ACP3TJ_11650, partial [Desulforudis sp. 1088]|uniref:hypothetical protein n=1 Tax=unclassified Candidatus Desulforudis TaxID=2635950 RepID=UPI003CF6583A